MLFHRPSLPLILLPLTCLPSTLAWGSLGHETVAYIASYLIAPKTTQHFQYLLKNDTEHYLASIATWADSYRYTSPGRYSAPLHFIDAEDHPPSSCSVKYLRDCGGNGCVVGAITNFTGQLMNPDLDFWSKNMAAKFVVHFLGDIHQPLHTEGLLRGGNSIPVNFTGKPVNLHHVWDTSIPEQLIGGYSLAYAAAWAHNLTLELTVGSYQPLTDEWVKDIDLGDPTTTALKWAQESNAYVCTTVLPEGVEGVEGKELSGEYYDEAVEVVKVQIAKAGLRLAIWLDKIAEAVGDQEKEEL